MRFLTGLCKDDVTTSNGDDLSKYKFDIHVQGKISGEITEGISQICHGSGVMQQKIGPGSF